jgi:hypothetical protein
LALSRAATQDADYHLTLFEQAINVQRYYSIASSLMKRPFEKFKFSPVMLLAGEQIDDNPDVTHAVVHGYGDYLDE